MIDHKRLGYTSNNGSYDYLENDHLKSKRILGTNASLPKDLLKPR